MSDQVAEPTTAPDWHLEGRQGDVGIVWRTSIRPLPFLVGRYAHAHLRLASGSVSMQHAELYDQEGRLWVRDLGSTNGTFVNGEPVREQALADGDIVHFADQEFRLTLVAPTAPDLPGRETTMQIVSAEVGEIAPRSIREIKEFLESIDSGSITAEFQPVIHLQSGGVIGYEALGRLRRSDLPCLPGELFAIAERLGLIRELSNAFRRAALSVATRLPASPLGGRALLFINTHPVEVRDYAELLADLEGFRECEPDMPVVIEIHEAAVTDLERFVRLREELGRLQIGLAFDDFGKGAARLQELCEAAPDYVKFDRQFAHELDSTPRRMSMVRALVSMMNEMDIRTVLEGVETEAEADVCLKAGFDLAQGWHFGRPAPIDTL